MVEPKETVSFQLSAWAFLRLASLWKFRNWVHFTLGTQVTEAGWSGLFPSFMCPEALGTDGIGCKGSKLGFARGCEGILASAHPASQSRTHWISRAHRRLHQSPSPARTCISLAPNRALWVPGSQTLPGLQPSPLLPASQPAW